MRRFIIRALAGSAAVLSAGLGTQAVHAEIVNYVIDPQQSTLTISGNLTDNFASQQTSGSLTTSFSGSIVADRGASTILFPGGSLLDAALQASNQQPRTDATPGSQAADYGRTAPGPFGSTTLEAIRGLQLDLFDDTFGVGATIAGDGTFASNSFGIDIDSGESDSLYATVPNEIDLSGKGTANGTGNGLSSVVLSGINETLTLKFATGAIGYNIAATGDSSISFTGTIVAIREVPEPAGLTMAVLAGAGLLARRRSRARS